ncbi:MAG: hypothetical protein F6K19_50985 [Cyanothece sp. SIO1E1]|nr:hypothetical protein [Cyanothece sp. SIO1E1]
MIGKPKESDWKVYRNLVPQLRERYLKEKNEVLATRLKALGKTETERFWDAFEQMKKEKKVLESCLDDFSRSNMFFSMTLMLKCGMLKKEDLNVFSKELQSELSAFVG